MYCGLDFRDPDGLPHLLLFLVARHYHLVRLLDKSRSGEVDVGAIKLRSLFPITYLAAIDTLNGSVAIFFNVASFKTSTTGDGRGRRERCVEINSSDSRDDI